MGEVVLATGRLVLHEWIDEAWDRFCALTNTPAVMRWLGEVMDEAGLQTFRERLDDYRSKFGHTFWACSRREDGGHLSGEVIGMVGFKRSNAEGQQVEGMLEIGWRLREDAWGRGYAKEAASACLDHGFAQYGDDEIIALTVEGNTASWGLMQRLGMTRQPHLEFHDPRYSAELNPTIVYLITREQWQAAQ
jgi:RimJ/RimL family protein N-acetyltransferase